jgi:hypothetical protein
MYPIMPFGQWSGGVCVLYAGMMQAKAYKAIYGASTIYEALSDSRLYPKSAFHKFININ